MADAAKFDDLKKLTREPIGRVLKLAKIKIKSRTPVEIGPKTTAAELLAELHELGETREALRVLCHALPGREATWLACLATRELLGWGKGDGTPALKAAEAWVYKPGEATQKAAVEAADDDMEDPARLCAVAATYGEGLMGPGEELRKAAAPPRMTAEAAYGALLKVIYAEPMTLDATMARQLARAMDIARGGSGRLPEDETDKAAGAGG